MNIAAIMTTTTPTNDTTMTPPLHLFQGRRQRHFAAVRQPFACTHADTGAPDSIAMPSKPTSRCRYPSCAAVATVGGYCATHHRTAAPRNVYDATIRKDDPRLAEAARIRSSVRWQRFRAWFRASNPLCADPFAEHGALPVPGAQVHHVIGLIERPDLACDEDNCRTLCTQCHSRIEQSERAGRSTAHLFAQSKRRITVVYGPPGSGKSTYVRTRFSPGDLIIDWDEIMRALSLLPMHEQRPNLLPFVRAAVKAVSDELIKTPGQTAWVIHSVMEPWLRERWTTAGASFVRLIAPREALLARVAGRPRRDWEPAIDAWFAAHRAAGDFDDPTAQNDALGGMPHIIPRPKTSTP